MAISGRTRLVGIIGWPVAHSKSPAMHAAAAAGLGLDLAYVPLPVPPDQLSQSVFGLKALGFLGANVTVPHKQAVLPFMDELDPAAQAIGAVNTIVIGRSLAEVKEKDARWSDDWPDPDNKLIGFNTDWSGFMADLVSYGIEIADRECLVLGAGGSARAVIYGLASAGGKVTVISRRREQAEQLISDLVRFSPIKGLRALHWPQLRAFSQKVEPEALIVNTTPLGMSPEVNDSPWPADLDFPTQAFVYDLVYNPKETRFLAQARAAGCRAANGLGMLLRQGAQAFELWTGLEPDLSLMAAALD